MLDQGIVVSSSNPEPLDVVIRTDGGAVTGTVNDAKGLAAVGITVVLAPTAERRHIDALYRTAEPDGAGRFVLRNCASGDYTVFAVSDAEVRDNARLADMAAKHESDARVVTVTPRSSADVLLRQN